MAGFFEQVDPIKVGELQRGMLIATRYGGMLNDRSKMLKTDTLGKLVAGYPTHGFVIDRKEAKSLFERVREPNWAEDFVSFCFTDEACDPRTIEHITTDLDNQTVTPNNVVSVDGDRRSTSSESPPAGNGTGGEGVQVEPGSGTNAPVA
jgi:hypothetical protein